MAKISLFISNHTMTTSKYKTFLPTKVAQFCKGINKEKTIPITQFHDNQNTLRCFLTLIIEKQAIHSLIFVNDQNY